VAPVHPAAPAEPVAAEPVAAEPTAAQPDVETMPVAEATTTDGDLAALVAQWPAIVAHVSQHPPTRPLISVCRPIAVDGTVVTLGFPEGMAFLADVAERRRANLEEGIARYLGHPVAVRCVATNLDITGVDPGATDGERLLVEARRIFADDLVEVAEVE
jgi:hypothetical protein